MERRAGRDRRSVRSADQRRLREIIERMADGLVIVDLEGVIRFANPAAERLFGRASSVLEGSLIGFPVVVDETAEIELVRPGGDAVSAELRVVDIDWEGAQTQLISIRDITDRKRAEEKSAQLGAERIARAEAEAASRAKSEFLAMMSHELRTPLNAVIGYADLLDLGMGGQLTAEQRQQVSRIAASGKHLLGLVNELLDLSKVEAGRLILQIGVASVGHIVDAALALVQPAAEARGIDLGGQCFGDGNAQFEGDEDRVRQILVNLLNNAVKFTEPGGSVSVLCGTADRPDLGARLTSGAWVYLRVTDTGLGIPSNRLGSIFDPFVQVERGHTRPADGAGLGLTISRRLARLMKGDLTVESVAGRGSTFTLWLPMAGDLAPTAVQRAESAEAAARFNGIAEIGGALGCEIEPLLTVFVGRLRHDSLFPRAHAIAFAQLADHVGTYVADVASILVAVEETEGQPSGLLADGADIQRLVAERHGAQRARLGWTEEALRQEWRILHEEIERAIHRRIHGVNEVALAEALGIIDRLLEQSREFSCRVLTRTLRENAAKPSELDR